jgi:hypothetical protein
LDGVRLYRIFALGSGLLRSLTWTPAVGAWLRRHGRRFGGPAMLSAPIPGPRRNPWPFGTPSGGATADVQRRVWRQGGGPAAVPDAGAMASPPDRGCPRDPHWVDRGRACGVWCGGDPMPSHPERRGPCFVQSCRRRRAARLTKALTRLLGDGGLRTHLAKQARELARACDLGRVTDAYVAVCARLSA